VHYRLIGNRFIYLERQNVRCPEGSRSESKGEKIVKNLYKFSRLFNLSFPFLEIEETQTDQCSEMKTTSNYTGSERLFFFSSLVLMAQRPAEHYKFIPFEKTKWLTNDS
jgi:hypothetical protein